MNKKLQVNIVDLKIHYKSLENEIIDVVSKVLLSGNYVLGKEVASFEKELSTYLNVKYCVGVASGTDALTLAVKSLGLGKGDGVIVPANVYPTVFGVSLSGVDIQLADVNPETFNIDIENVKKVFNSRTKAIVAVHLYGNPVNIDPLKKFANEKGIFLIEDCAQAIGSEYEGKKVGGIGDVSCFSFYPTKNLGAFGDGGAIATNNKKIYGKIKLFRMYGEKSRYQSILLGHNSRLDEIQAAILMAKLKHLDKWNKKRNEIASKYIKNLKDLPITFQKIDSGMSVYHLFTIQTTRRNEIMKYLKERDISTGIHYPVPIHLTKSFKYLGHEKGDFPNSEKLCNSIISLPMYPEMNNRQIDYVIENIRGFFNKQ